MLHFRVALLICLYKVNQNVSNLRKVINDGKTLYFTDNQIQRNETIKPIYYRHSYL